MILYSNHQLIVLKIVFFSTPDTKVYLVGFASNFQKFSFELHFKNMIQTKKEGVGRVFFWGGGVAEHIDFPCHIVVNFYPVK